ncbi:hypothetical protein CYY_005668 [Polysphondylium violaceum]|uniref:ABC transporter C family protein n=1 Tax=Polysphondylium violaceum TaxID=133409 RepID=A0A8J4V3Y0_9MYCE|nr:hypothetical protein CYY_005668 [Polysphondylium violaceum]
MNFLRSRLASYFKLTDYQDVNDSFSKECPENNASLISKITFQWIQKLLFKGYFHGPLQLDDISDLPDSLKTSHSFNLLKGMSLDSKYSFLLYVYKTFGLEHKSVIVFKIISLVFSILTPIILNLFLTFVSQANKNIYQGWGYCLGLFFSAMILSVSLQQANWRGLRLVLQIRGSLSTLIFKKMFLLSNTAKRKFKFGSIVNLMLDCDFFQLYFWSSYLDIILFPIEIISLIILLCFVIGPSGLIGFVIMGLSIPATTLSSSKMTKFLRLSMAENDNRIDLISELIGGIRFLKQFGWESVFTNKIQDVRAKQLKILYTRILFWILNQMIVQSTNALVLLSTFSVYILLGNELSASVAFTALTIFVNLRKPMENFPSALQSLLGLIPCSQRMRDYFTAEEIQNPPFNLLDQHQSLDFSLKKVDITNGDVEIENGSFDWEDGAGQKMEKTSSESDNLLEMSSQEPKKSNNVLSNISFNAPKGKLTIICGQVGSGKTSLVSALIGEIYKVDGRISKPESMAFTPQQAFLVSASLRENILFGKPYDKERYAQVIYACSLDTDLLQLPGKDLTEIGERGINLSGGQKQRISLARALYSDAECFILDEPLSAVDPEVGKHLFDHCIQGMMQGKTRILVTHQLQFIPSADHIVVVQDGNLIQGTYSQLQQLGIDFESIMKTKKLNIEPENQDQGKKPDLLNNESKQASIESIISDENDPDIVEKSKLLVKEDRNEGSVSLSVYLEYLSAGGPLWFFFTFVVGLYLLSQVLFQGSEYWISIWTQRVIQPDPGNKFYLLIYLYFIGGFIVLLGLRYFLLSRHTFKSTANLHNELLNSVAYASCQFFDQNPSGRIINRFSRDVSDIDYSLTEMLSSFIYLNCSVLVSLVIMVFLNPFIVIPFFVLSIIYFIIQRIYVESSRELKRMESIARSPVYNTFAETFNGVTTIRAFSQQQRFITDLESRLNIALRLIFYSYSIHRWCEVRMEVLASVIVFFSSIFTLYNSSTNAGATGLAITTALSLTGLLNRTIKNFTDIELKMNSVERLKSYIDTPREGGEDQPTFNPKAIGNNWPQSGSIEYRNVEIRYRADLEPSLSDISFSIKNNEKIGIVGRTGAGKSTIGVSLLRMVETTKGSIFIDGVDISKIRLHDLRSRLGIIPQDPFIFSGTIRANLDPYEQYTDQEIWEALEKVQMNTVVQNMSDKLNSAISVNGEGLSVGQKQLLCLARALLRNSKIVLMDEATASLDYETDYIIKQTVKNNFQNSTVLTIAHRLDTIIDSDKILVIDKGQMVEFDSPQNLVNNPNSRFAQIVNSQTSFLYNNK